MTFPSIRLMLVVLAATVALPVAVHAAEVQKREPVIVVSGEADSAIRPDMAILSLGVTKLEKTAREALDGNNAAMAAVLKALKEEGIADKDLQTSGFSIQPQYSYPENDGQRAPELTGYQVTNTVTVRLRDLAKLGALLDKTVTLGVNQGGDIRFTNDKPEKAIEDARKAAVKAAVAKARTLASAAGVKLGRVLEISENASAPEPQPMLRMQMKAAEDSSVPIAAGENSYSVSVNMTFAIE
jgi:uncharacterized protein